MKNKLLVVDDQLGIRMLLTDIFENEGYEVETAETGKEGWDKIVSGQIDLIVLDYRLPLINGDEVIQKMRDCHMNTPVILMSGLVEELDESIKQETETLKIVAKPFDIGKMCQIVSQLLA